MVSAVGQVDTLVLAIGNGSGRTLYAGPVLSHYQCCLPQSPSDEQWARQVSSGKAGSRPNWTKPYLYVPTVEVSPASGD